MVRTMGYRVPHLLSFNRILGLFAGRGRLTL